MTDVVELLSGIAALIGGNVADDIRKGIDELERLRGASRASDERLRKAGERVGMIAGCDTAEWMADEIERLRAAVKAENEACARIAAGFYGEARSKRLAKGMKLSRLDPHEQDCIVAEENGEDIASELIAAAIRARMEAKP